MRLNENNELAYVAFLLILHVTFTSSNLDMNASLLNIFVHGFWIINFHLVLAPSRLLGAESWAAGTHVPTRSSPSPAPRNPDE